MTEVADFLRWLEGAAPRVYGTLAPPPPPVTLSRLTELAAVPLPSSFLALYQAHDGQLGEDLAFVPYYYLMPIDHVVGSHDMLQEAEDDDGEQIWKPSWIPFAGFDCDYLFIDTATGAVHAYYPKFDDAWPMIAPSFTAFLARIREATEAGQFTVSEEDGMTDDPDAKLNWVAVWELRVKRDTKVVPRSTGTKRDKATARSTGATAKRNTKPRTAARGTKKRNKQTRR